MLRYHGDYLLVKHFKWYEGKTIVAMAFDPSAQWLCVVMEDMSLALIPAYNLVKSQNDTDLIAEQNEQNQRDAAAAENASSKFLSRLGLGKKADSQHQQQQQQQRNKATFSDLTDLTLVKPGAGRVRSNARGCIWWRTPKKKSICITSSNSALGSFVIFVDLESGKEELAVKMRQGVGVSSLQMVRQTFPDTDCWLIISTAAHGDWKMPVSLSNRTILELSDSDEFAPFPLNGRFPSPGTRLCPQTIHRRQKPTTVISVYSSATDKLLVFDESLGKHAMYAYQLSPSASEILTDRFIFSAHGSSFHVISTLFAGTSAQPHFSLRVSRDSLMQTLQTDKQKEIQGLFPPFAPASLLIDPFAGGGAVDEALEGCFVWTENCVYRCTADVSPEQIFLDMIRKGLESKEAEPLGKACGLDVLGLYEVAAEQAYEAKNYGRALELYFLAEIDTSRLVQRYLAIGRLDVVILHLTSALRGGLVLEPQKRKQLATMLMLCRLYVALESTKEHTSQASLSMTSETNAFLEFASSDTNYDVDDIMCAALSAGAVSLALHVAHFRACVKLCVDLISEKVKPPAKWTFKSLLPLNRADLIFIAKHGELTMALLEPILAPAEQLQLVVGSHSLVVPVIRALLPQMSQSDLRLAEAMLTCLIDDIAQLQMEVVEIYINVVLSLIAHDPTSYDDNTGVLAYHEALRDLDVPVVVASNAAAANIKARSVCCGWNHSSAITEHGALFVWGRMRSARSHVVVPTPIVQSFGVKVCVVSVACGGEHTLAADRDGNLYAWGLNDHGQLCFGDVLSSEKPKFTGVGNVVKVACGFMHSAFLDSEGKLWTCGLDDDGQCTGTNVSRDVLVPYNLGRTVSNIVGVSLGYLHTAFWTEDCVFTCGNNSFGQLGRTESTVCVAPVICERRRIQSVCCGHFSTFAVTDIGSVYRWGGKKEKEQKPKLIEGLVGRRVVKVASGDEFALFLTVEGELYGQGNIVFEKEELSQIKTAVPISDIACGEEFCLAVTCEGQVVSWGNGTTGQLGYDCSQCDPVVITPHTFSLPTPTRTARSSQSNNNHEHSNNNEEDDMSEKLFQHKLYRALLKQSPTGVSLHRPNVVSELCTMYENWAGASAVYAMQGKFVLATFCRAKSCDCENEWEGLLTALDEWVIQAKPVFDPRFSVQTKIVAASSLSGNVRANIFWQALWRWDRLEYPVQPLADWIEDALTQSPVFCSIVQSLLVFPLNPTPTEPYLPLIVRLPASTLIKCAVCVQHEDSDTSPLWESIRSNLKSKTIEEYVAISLKNRSSNVVVSGQELSENGIGFDSFSSTDSIVFSCGHYLSLDEFKNSGLMQVQKALNESSTWRKAPLATKIVMAEYSLNPQISMSCPRCFIATL